MLVEDLLGKLTSNVSRNCCISGFLPVRYCGEGMAAMKGRVLVDMGVIKGRLNSTGLLVLLYASREDWGKDLNAVSKCALPSTICTLTITGSGQTVKEQHVRCRLRWGCPRSSKL